MSKCFLGSDQEQSQIAELFERVLLIEFCQQVHRSLVPKSLVAFASGGGFIVSMLIGCWKCHSLSLLSVKTRSGVLWEVS